ncbi:6-hydroxy-D-nicotine oxidase 1 [Botrytis cinerea]
MLIIQVTHESDVQSATPPNIPPPTSRDPAGTAQPALSGRLRARSRLIFAAWSTLPLQKTDRVPQLAAAPTGHGWLQGQYGLMADQVTSARLLLPSGKLVTVSENSYPSLFWAIRGAGHNFGLAMEWEYRVYDNDAPLWSYEIFIYSGDKLESLYEEANRLLRDQPAELVHWRHIIKAAEIDPDHISHSGAVCTDWSGITRRSRRRHISRRRWPRMHLRNDILRYPIGLKSYNVTAVRQVYNEIDSTFRKVPEIAGSFFLVEGYSTQAVKAIDAVNTAFPHRDDNILVTSYVMYAPDSNIDPIAKEFGEKRRKYLLDGSEDPEHLRAYVNYTDGDESLQAIYGWETWRLEKLKKLKAQWDPKNAMRYYVPIEQNIN